MKTGLVFAITIFCAFWAADQFCFDGVYSAKIWKQGNQFGAVWQHDAKLWLRQHGYY
jgi:hypothetical protein